MRINTNVAALNSWRNLQNAGNAMGKNLEKLSSGLRINKAADDAAGLAISEKMRAQIRGLNQAVRNSQDGISLVQTAEGAMANVEAMLQRMRELATQAASGGVTDSDRSQIQLEIAELKTQIGNVASQTKFNKQSLIDKQNTFTIQAGANESETMTLTVASMTATDLSVNTIDVAPATNAQADAQKAITTINNAIEKVSSARAQLGAFQNRLEFNIENLQISSENLQAAESRIRDVDMASEMTTFSKNQILVQSGTAMLAQANSLPQSVLKLLG